MKKDMLACITVCCTIAGITFAACKRDYTTAAGYNTPNGTAFLRIVHAAPNFRNIYSMPDTFNVLLNGTKITGFVPGGAPLLTYGNIFPTVSSANGYVTVPAGTQEFKFSMGALNPDSVTIKRFTKELVPNTYYSLVITDSINSDKDSAQIFVRDNITKPTVGYFNLRFIHAVWNDTTGKSVDIWSTRNNRFLFNNMKPGTVTTFATFAYNAQLNDTLFVRRTGTGQTLATFNNVAFSNKRTYTLYYKGDGTLTTGTRARGLAMYVHQ